MDEMEFECGGCQVHMRVSSVILAKLRGRVGRVTCKRCGNHVSLDGQGAQIVIAAGASPVSSSTGSQLGLPSPTGSYQPPALPNTSRPPPPPPSRTLSSAPPSIPSPSYTSSQLLPATEDDDYSEEQTEIWSGSLASSLSRGQPLTYLASQSPPAAQSASAVQSSPAAHPQSPVQSSYPPVQSSYSPVQSSYSGPMHSSGPVVLPQDELAPSQEARSMFSGSTFWLLSALTVSAIALIFYMRRAEPEASAAVASTTPFVPTQRGAAATAPAAAAPAAAVQKEPESAGGTEEEALSLEDLPEEERRRRRRTVRTYPKAPRPSSPPETVAVEPSAKIPEPKTEVSEPEPEAVSLASPPDGSDEALLRAMMNAEPQGSSSAPSVLKDSAAEDGAALTEVDEAASETESDSSTPAAFNKQSAKTSFARAAVLASACKRDEGLAGTARVLVTFAPSGSVSSSTVQGAPFAGTATGSCVARTFRSLSVPAFSGGAVTLSKSVIIR